MALGRDKSKQILCEYEGRKQDCPKDCSKCTVTYRNLGDSAFKKGQLIEAIKQYKRALFASPINLDAWYGLASAYSSNKEFNNAIEAFDRALSIDPQYGDAMFGKAVALRDLGKKDEAIALSEDILELYPDKQVSEFSEDLVFSGFQGKTTSKSIALSCKNAIEAMTEKAFEIATDQKWLDADGTVKTEKEIDQEKDFAEQMYLFCNRNYSSLGYEKAWSEAITSSFYGAICVTLLYYKDRSWVENSSTFDYLKDHVDLERVDRTAEKLLGIQDDDNKTDNLWDAISSYASYCIKTINNVQPMADMENAVLDAAESAYILGMLCAMRHNEALYKQKQKNDKSDVRGAFCNNCGKKIVSDAVFCPYCGSKRMLELNKENCGPEESRNELIKTSKRVKTKGKPGDYYFPGNATVEGATLQLLTPVKVDVEDALKHGISGVNKWAGNECKIIDENDEFVFYNYHCYEDGSGGCTLRQRKANRNDVVFFGTSKKFGCIFHNHLVQVDCHEYGNEFYVWSKDIQNGTEKLYSWFGRYAIPTGRGSRYTQDYVKVMRIDRSQDAIILEVQRTALSPSPMADDWDKKLNVETNYSLVITYSGGDLRAKAVYPALGITEIFENVYA